jgi:hypothetical protein
MDFFLLQNTLQMKDELFTYFCGLDSFRLVRPSIREILFSFAIKRQGTTPRRLRI